MAAAIREAQEEAGIRTHPEDVKVVGVMHRRSSDERVDFFVADKAAGSIATGGSPGSF